MLPDFGCCHGLEALAERRKTLTRSDSLPNETPVAARVWTSGRERPTNDACDCVFLSQDSTEAVPTGDEPVFDDFCPREGTAGEEPVSDGIRAHGAPAEACKITVGDVVMFNDGKKGMVHQVILVSGEWVVQAMLDGEIMRAATVRDLHFASSASGELSDPDKFCGERGLLAPEKASVSAEAKTAKGQAKGKAKAKTSPKAKSKAKTKASPKAKSKAAKTSPTAKGKAQKTSPVSATAKGKGDVGTSATPETQGEGKLKAKKLEDPEAYEKRKAYCRERSEIIKLSSSSQRPAAVLTEKQEFFRDRILCRPCRESLCCQLRSLSEPLSSTIRSKILASWHRVGLRRH